ncbi:TauD/TfdA dioxygenase family protein, partial [Streptomyces sp. NPDC056405]
MTTSLDAPASVPPPLRPHRIPADGLYEGRRILRRTPDDWPDRPYELFDVVPQSATIGAEVRGPDLSRPLSPALRAELNRALLEWKVLFFRGQHLTS